MGTYEYSTVIQANSHNVANTDKTFIEITAPASTVIKIKRVSAQLEFGVTTASSDAHFRVTLCRKSVAGTGGIAGTIISRDPNGPASVSTVKVKDTTVDFTVGTISDTIDIFSIHASNIFEWFAADEADKIVVLPADIFGILGSWPSGTQKSFTYAVTWEE